MVYVIGIVGAVLFIYFLICSICLLLTFACLIKARIKSRARVKLERARKAEQARLQGLQG